MSKEIKNYGSKQHGCGITELRNYGTAEGAKHESTELRIYEFTEVTLYTNGEQKIVLFS